MDANVNLAGDQAFTFIGNGTKFSDTAGELRFNAIWVEGDLDGDAVAGFFHRGEPAKPQRIRLHSVTVRSPTSSATTARQ